MKKGILISMIMIACLTVSVSAVPQEDLVLYRLAGNTWHASHTQPSPVWLNYVTTTELNGPSYPVGAISIKPLIGDVTGDGIDDMVITYGDIADSNRLNWTAGHSTIDWYTGVGLFSTAATSTMKFGPPISVGSPGGADIVIARFLADIQGDSAEDAICVDTDYYWRGAYSSGGLSKTAYGVTGPYQFGLSGDIPLVGNFDGDLNTGNTWGDANINDICVYRPSDGGWYVAKSGPGGYFGAGGQILTGNKFGLPTDTPLVGDINGDGRDDGIVVSDFDSDGNLEWRAAYADTNGAIDYHGGDTNWITGARFGITGDVPFVADINGDGKADIGVIRTSNISGNKYVYISFTRSDGKLNVAAQFVGVAPVDDRAMYGASTDISLIGQIGNPPVGICVYQLEGDTNGDCVVNLADLAEFVGTWLVDCVNNPGNPECMY